MAEKQKPSKERSQARKKAAKLGMDQNQFTLVVCMDRKTAKCCSAKAMGEIWKSLKTRSRDWRKSDKPPILKIKAGCIGVCKGGPLIGVFPDGVWYGNCSPQTVDRIFDEHLEGGNIVTDHVIARNAAEMP